MTPQHEEACPRCDNPLELEQRGTKFFCAHCGTELDPSGAAR